MEWISGNIFIRPLGGNSGFEVGQVCAGHTHNFDHTTVFFNGLWRARKWKRAVDANGTPLGDDVWIETASIERAGPFHLLIEAAAKHEFTYLGPEPIGRAWCLYSHRTPQGEVSVDSTGWEKAYV